MAKSLLNPLNENDSKKSLFGRVNASGADKKDEKTAGAADAEMGGGGAGKPAEGAGAFSVANPLARKLGDGDGGSGVDGSGGGGGGAAGGFKKPSASFKTPSAAGSPAAKAAITVDVAPVESNLAPPPPPPPGPPPAFVETAAPAQLETPAAAAALVDAVVAPTPTTMADVYSNAAAVAVAAAEPSAQAAVAVEVEASLPASSAASHFATNLTEVHLNHVEPARATSDALAEHVPTQLADAISHLQHVDVAAHNTGHNPPAVPVEPIAEVAAPTEAS